MVRPWITCVACGLLLAACAPVADGADPDDGRPVVGRLLTRDGIIPLTSMAFETGVVPSSSRASRVMADVEVDLQAEFEARDDLGR